MLLLVPSYIIIFFWFFETKHLEKNNKQKLFVLYLYIMNKDGERQCANLIPCKQLHNVV